MTRFAVAIAATMLISTGTSGRSTCQNRVYPISPSALARPLCSTGFSLDEDEMNCLNGCEGEIIARGLCSKCYHRLKQKVRTGQLTWKIAETSGLANAPIVKNATHPKKIPGYRSWAQMLQRCTNRKDKAYHNYGGRGIVVCNGMRRFSGFLKTMGVKPSRNRTLDRIDNDGNYSCGECDQCRQNNWPMNCRWATWDVQHSNKRSNIYHTYNGQTLTIVQWAKVVGMPTATLQARIRYGWSIERTLETPNDAHIHWTEYRNKKYSIRQLADMAGLSFSGMKKRLQLGWTVEDAVETPVGHKRKAVT